MCNTKLKCQSFRVKNIVIIIQDDISTKYQINHGVVERTVRPKQMIKELSSTVNSISLTLHFNIDNNEHEANITVPWGTPST